MRFDIVAAQKHFESLRIQAVPGEQTEHEVFLRANADAETIAADVDSLTAHNKVLQDAVVQSHEIQQRAADVLALTEREESAARTSELEVEILVLKKSQENAEDEHKRTLGHLQGLEDEDAEAVTTTEQVWHGAEAQVVESMQGVVDVAILRQPGSIHQIGSR